jgi:hypothetical protein
VRKLLKVAVLALAVILGPRIALADALAAAPPAASEVLQGDPSLQTVRSCDSVSDACSNGAGAHVQPRKFTWGFARRWRLAIRAGAGGFVMIRGSGGLASVSSGGEDGGETGSQQYRADVPGGDRSITRSTWPKRSEILTASLQ